MTKRAYYTDPLYAAIACRDFGIELHIDGKVIPLGKILEYASGWYVAALGILDTSMPLLTPRVGDRGGDGEVSGAVVAVSTSTVVIKTPDPRGGKINHCISRENFIIENRDGKFFPWPEWE